MHEPRHAATVADTDRPIGARTRRLRRRKVGITALALVLIGLFGGAATWSVFTDTTDNPGNAFNAASIDLTDDDSGTFMFNVSNMQPGQSETRCIEVTYTGSTDATVKLYATDKGTGLLNPKLNVGVKRGTATGDFPSCGTFTEDNPAAVTHGALTIDTFPADYANGLDGSTWSTTNSHVYQFTVTLDASAGQAEEGQSGGVTFVWEAQPVL